EVDLHGIGLQERREADTHIGRVGSQRETSGGVSGDEDEGLPGNEGSGIGCGEADDLIEALRIYAAAGGNGIENQTDLSCGSDVPSGAELADTDGAEGGAKAEIPVAAEILIGVPGLEDGNGVLESSRSDVGRPHALVGRLKVERKVVGLLGLGRSLGQQ